MEVCYIMLFDIFAVLLMWSFVDHLVKFYCFTVWVVTVMYN